ncbi:hypothetical protein RRF57_002394 [Xylaria bambusicola]|uniref:Heterokaryon incompatibility domain-containing protein n=1 Tax=Xylaria bambusicola TaxID=326684 RepID=A0AAN7UD15_9PEZI
MDSEGPSFTPISVPNISSIQLLRAWLAKCDQSHKCRQHRIENRHNKYTPATRLLNVSPSSNPDDLRLDVSKVGTDRYIALSHCWGQSDLDRLPPHCTTKDNVKRRQGKFKLSELPKTFQDAIEVTRELGVQYLWIDSICIIQGRHGDWEQESKRMDQVFASAYCTIAATSAENSNSGFLGRQVDHDGIYVQGPEGRRICVSTNVADFDNDINGANINKRAWVMQERFLSPRTIHFGKNQVYGECGEEVYAGGKIFLTCDDQSKKYFRLDPKFPNRLRQSGWVATLEFLQSLLEDYTRRGISIQTDRAVAISGLTTRIGEALRSSIHHGIIEWYLHRTLLWQRSSGQKMERIDYGPSKVPSWSWMAYKGAIEFVPDKFGDLRLIKNLVFDAQILTATVWELTDRSMKIEADGDVMQCQLVDLQGLKKGWISFDEEAELTMLPDVVVVARRETAETDNCRYYVLFVRFKESQDVYERIGMGMLQEDCGLRGKGKGRKF